MRRLTIIILTLLTVFSAQAKVDKALLDQLDSYLKNRDTYVQQKEQRIETGRRQLHQARTPQEEFRASTLLSEEFFSSVWATSIPKPATIWRPMTDCT